MPKPVELSPGDELRAERRRLGVSRASLAGLAGVSISSLERIEQGACPARSRVLEQARDALAVLAAEREARLAA